MGEFNPEVKFTELSSHLGEQDRILADIKQFLDEKVATKDDLKNHNERIEKLENFQSWTYKTIIGGLGAILLSILGTFGLIIIELLRQPPPR